MEDRGQFNKGSIESLTRLCGSARGDVVLDVAECGRDSLKFNVLTWYGGGFTYATRHYDLSGGNGLFDMLDDFCRERICFFHSSKSVQAFLLSLNGTEEKFFSKHGFDYLDYYTLVNEETVGTVNKNSQDGRLALAAKATDGYGISDESKSAYDIKRKLLDDDGYFGEIVGMVCEDFPLTLSEIRSGGFCRICIGLSDEPHVLLDSILGLPLIFHSRKLMDTFLRSAAEPFTVGGLLPTKAESSVEYDSWDVSPETTIEKILCLCDGSGRLFDGYDPNTFSSTSEFAVKCERLSFAPSSYGEDRFVASVM